MKALGSDAPIYSLSLVGLSTETTQSACRPMIPPWGKGEKIKLLKSPPVI